MHLQGCYSRLNDRDAVMFASLFVKKCKVRGRFAREVEKVDSTVHKGVKKIQITDDVTFP